MRRVATMGDIHGSIDELRTLYKMLEWESLDEIRHTGDLVDRGPDSAAVIDFCRTRDITGVLGNHDAVINEWLKAYPKLPKNPDKARTIAQLKASDPKNLEYLRNLPHIHVDDAMGVVYVHGGVRPHMPFHNQPAEQVCRLAMINPAFPGEVRWMHVDRKGRTEKENRKEGWVCWWEVYDHPYDVVFGHTVFQHGPFVYQSPYGGRCIGVDTGCNWSGELTAVILPDLKFIATPRTKEFTNWHDTRE